MDVAQLSYLIDFLVLLISTLRLERGFKLRGGSSLNAER